MQCRAVYRSIKQQDSAVQWSAVSAASDLNIDNSSLNQHSTISKNNIIGAYSDKAAFILCKTSNPSSKDLQEKQLSNGEVMFESVAKLCNGWNSSRTEQQLREHNSLLFSPLLFFSLLSSPLHFFAIFHFLLPGQPASTSIGSSLSIEIARSSATGS